MDNLALLACNAHGGISRWLATATLTARVLVERTSAGRVFATEFGIEAGMQLAIVCLDDYGPDRHVTSYMSDRVELFDAEGALIECGSPATIPDWQGRLGLSDDLGDICSLSLSMWTYLNFPFIATLDGFTCTERDPLRNDGEEQRTLLVEFPPDQQGSRSRFLAHISSDGRTERLDWYARNQTRLVSMTYMIKHADIDGLLLPSHIVALHAGERNGSDAAFTDIFFSEVHCV